MSDAEEPRTPTPEKRSAAFLAAVLGSPANQARVVHLDSLQAALGDIELVSFALEDVAELLKALGLPDEPVSSAAVRAVAAAMQDQVRRFHAAFSDAHAACAILTGRGAAA